MAVAHRLSAAGRYAVSGASRPEALVARITSSLSFVPQVGLAARADFRHRSGIREGWGCVDDFRDGSSQSCLSGIFGRLVGTRLPVNGGPYGGRFDGVARQPEMVFHARSFTAKTKKAKSKIEPSLEPVEDVAAIAKGNAVKMMEAALDALSKEHSKLRTGRASAGMLDHITVEAHGVRTPLNHIAAVTVSGLQTLSVLPYDGSMVKEVEKAILNSPMGLNPQVDGATMTVPLPRLTKEHCETMCKLVSKAGESAKLTIRRARKDALDTAKSGGDFSKDEMKRFEKDVEELTKKYTRTIDDTCKSKEKEIVV